MGSYAGLHDDACWADARRYIRHVSAPPAKGAVDATFDAIAAELVGGGEVAVAGFGKFSVRERSARRGRNPSTGEPVQIAARKAAKFSVGAALKRRLRGAG